MRAFLVLGIVKDHLESLEVGVNVCDYRVSHAASLLPNYLESAKFIFDWAPLCFFLPDKMAQAGISNRLLKLLKLVSFAFYHTLHPSVWQITDDASDVEAMRHVLGGRPEPHSLDATRIKHVKSLSGHLS
jgi:hypothetical protein